MINGLLVDICNEAIGKASMDAKISSLDENSNLADLCNDLWESVFRFVYSSYPWAFKTIRGVADLQTLADDPLATQRQNTFGYPDKCLRIMGFYRDAAYRLCATNARVSSDKDGNTVILADVAPLYIEYVTGNTPNDNVSPWLREVLTLKLGLEIARRKGKDIRNLNQELLAALDSAEEKCATEMETHVVRNDDYINVRG